MFRGSSLRSEMVAKIIDGNRLAQEIYGELQADIRQLEGYDIEGKHIVICDQSNVVGKPLAASSHNFVRNSEYSAR
mgnify:CR=1 FL=1